MANNFQNFQLPNTQSPNQQNSQAQLNNMMLPNYQQNTILFPQPIGNVYNLNTAADIANIPTGAGVSLGLCLAENILYIKALQNGAPALLTYKLGPVESNDIAEDNDKIKQILQSFENRFTSIEKQLSSIKEKVGGSKIKWPNYNANPLGRKVNDCTVRAIALATNESWDSTYNYLSDYAQQEAVMMDNVIYIDKFLDKNFEKIYTNAKGYNMTVDDVSKRWYKGTYLITMKNHITCCIDGVIYDTFNPSDRLVWEVYKVK